MTSINAVSIAPDARDWSTNSCQPRILHVFDRACNLINERREVLSIVTQQIGNGPFNLVIDGPVIFSKQLNVESQISLDTNRLRVGEITINTNNAKLWSPRPDWETLHAKKDSIIDQIMSLQGRWLSSSEAAYRNPARTNPLANLEIALSHTVLRSVQGSALLH